MPRKRSEKVPRRAVLASAFCIPLVFVLAGWISSSPAQPKSVDLATLEVDDFLNSTASNSTNTAADLPSPKPWSHTPGLVFVLALILILTVYVLYVWWNTKLSGDENASLARPKNTFKIPIDIQSTLQTAVHDVADKNSDFSSWFFGIGKNSSALALAKSPISCLGYGISPSMLSISVILWLFVGTIVVSRVAAWPLSQSFFFIVNTGLARGFSAPVPLGADSSIGQAITVINELFGAILFGAALAFLIDSLLERVRGDAMDAAVVKCSDNDELMACFSQVHTGGPFKTIPIDTTHSGFVDGIGVDTSGDGFVDTVIVRRQAVLFSSDRICFSAALAAWLALGTAYGMLCEGWGPGQALYFAFTTLGIGGVSSLGADARGFLPAGHAWAVGVFVLVGVPLFASTAATFAGFLLEQSIRQRDRDSIDGHIPLQEFELAMNIMQPDDKLDRAEFVLLELLRMRKADVTTLALIFKKFDEIDSSHDGTVDLAEIKAYNEHLAALQGQQLSYRLPWRE